MSSGRRSNQSGTPTTPIGKKLVQARLPFKSLSPSCSTVAKPGNGDNTRKRKLSAVDDSSPKAKINRITGPSTAENVEILVLSDGESEPVVPEERVIELTSDDEPAAEPTDKESLPETPKGRKSRKSASKTVTPKQSSRKSSPRSLNKRKLNGVDVTAVVSEESSFSIKLPLPKKRTKMENKTVSPLNDAKKDAPVVVLSTDNDDSSLSEDSSEVKNEPAADPKVNTMDVSSSEEESAGSDVTTNEKTENGELQSSPNIGEFL